MEKKIGKYHWLWAFIFLATSLVAQEVQLTARSSRTSVGLDEPFRVTFSCNARGGDLIPPSFEHFSVVSGPYSSQQTQIINGSMSFSRELTYQLVAQEEGTFTIDPATLKIKGKEFQSNRLTIEVKAGVRKERSQSVPKSALSSAMNTTTKMRSSSFYHSTNGRITQFDLMVVLGTCNITP